MLCELVAWDLRPQHLLEVLIILPDRIMYLQALRFEVSDLARALALGNAYSNRCINPQVRLGP